MHGGVLLKRRNMRRTFFLVMIMAALVLSGCSRTGEIIELSDGATEAGTGEPTELSDKKTATGAGENAAHGSSSGASQDMYSEGSGNTAVALAAPDEMSSGQSGGADIDGSAVGAAFEATCYVYVCGAVVSPGVYELSEGSRIDNAVDAAGGFSADADEAYVNLAAKVSDGMKLYIPTTEETGIDKAGAQAQLETYDSYDASESADAGDAASSGGAGLSSGSGLVNINRASKQELTKVPGIGDVTADKIIRYREENGNFASIEDIKKVSGIKDKLFSKIRDYITV